MNAEDALPCRHVGAPSENIIELTRKAIVAISNDNHFLSNSGLTREEFELALPVVLQRMRGSVAASNNDRRSFIQSIIDRMKVAGLIEAVRMPKYGADTVYRLEVPQIGAVAIIQKGCPDGTHSSENWDRPDWAREAYLWWLCDSVSNEPGEHVVKGVNRLRNRFFDMSTSGGIDGVVFHNATCGSPSRPCPKIGHAIDIDGTLVPPPCIWVMPERTSIEPGGASSWNWDGERDLLFPKTLMSLFGLNENHSKDYVGYVGFNKGARGTRGTISTRFGAGKNSIFRSKSR